VDFEDDQQGRLTASNQVQRPRHAWSIVERVMPGIGVRFNCHDLIPELLTVHPACGFLLLQGIVLGFLLVTRYASVADCPSHTRCSFLVLGMYQRYPSLSNSWYMSLCCQLSPPGDKGVDDGDLRRPGDREKLTRWICCSGAPLRGWPSFFVRLG